MQRIALALALVTLTACTDSATDPAADLPQYGRTPTATTYYVGLSMTDAGMGITSDGKSATILGALTPASYANGECGVSAAINLTDIIADILPSGASGKRSCVGRTVRLRLDTPIQPDGTPGGPAFGTVASGTHIKMQDLPLVTASSGPTMIDVGFNQLSGAGDCVGIRHNANFGGDRVQATRTRTRGVNADRNEWLVETLPGADRAACVTSGGGDAQVIRYYRIPVRFTVTQLNY